MAIVNVNPKMDKRRILEQGGQYGQGLQHQADVELTNFESPNEEGKLDRMPPFDKDGEEGPYWYLNIKVATPDGKRTFVQEWQRSRQLRTTLQVIGVPVTDNPDGTFTFDDSQVAPRKLGGIEVEAPRETPDGRRFGGRVKQIIGG